MQIQSLHSMSESDILKMATDLQGILVKQVSFFSQITSAVFMKSSFKKIPTTMNVGIDAWIKSVNQKELLNHNIYLALKNTNAVYKTSIKKIINCIENSEVSPESDYKMLMASHELMIKDVVSLLTELMETKFQFDPLTGAINRGAFEKILTMEQSEVDRKPKTSFLAFADIDLFKKINDTYGHDMGDLVLVDVVKVFMDSVRDTDAVSRWGGEEFLILITDSTLQGANNVLVRIKNKIEKTIFELGDETLTGITCSFGLTKISKGSPIEKDISSADAALYKAKKTGRNKIVYKEN